MLHYIAAGLILFASVFHSFAGQRKLIAPALAVSDPFIQQPSTQAIIRFGWHSSSGFFLLTALALVLPETPETLEYAIGGLWLLLGVVNLVMLRAKHPGGYLLSLIGLLTLVCLQI